MQHGPNCGGGELKIIAAILERLIIQKILTHQGLDPQPPPRVRKRARRSKISQPEPRPEPHRPSQTPRPSLQRKTAAGVAMRDASARHPRVQAQP